MNVIDELKEVIDVKIVIDEPALSNKIFDQAVDPLMKKLTDLIPTEFDDAFYASKKNELRAYFLMLVQGGVDKLEDASGLDLDGKEE